MTSEQRYEFTLKLNSMNPEELANFYQFHKSLDNHEKCYFILLAAQANCGIQIFLADYLEHL